MRGTELSEPLTGWLGDPEFKEKLSRLRKRDNYTNIYYLAKVWLILFLVIGGTLWFYSYRSAAGLSSWWNVPITLLAIVAIGACQHQLAGATHEATHHILFKNRYLNELVSDWFCMFPLFSSTYQFRLTHLCHHQFINDPVRDADVLRLQSSGHWLRFPVSQREFLLTLLKQLWVPNLFKYILARIRFDSLGVDSDPYMRKGSKPSMLATGAGIAYMFGLSFLLFGLVWFRDPMLLGMLPLVCWGAIVAFYGLLPERLYYQSRFRPVIPMRVMAMMRVTFITGLFWALAWANLLFGWRGLLYFLLLWIVPIFTSFAFFMMLRNIVQHGNADRGQLTNTRIFFVNPFINFAVFPFGMDYHLPHHMFASVPHYRLGQLHELLLKYPDYRRRAVTVEGYFLPKSRPQKHPTVLEVLGPRYAPREPGEIFIDNTVLEDDSVEEKDEILRSALE